MYSELDKMTAMFNTEVQCHGQKHGGYAYAYMVECIYSINECSSWRLLMPLGMFCFALECYRRGRISYSYTMVLGIYGSKPTRCGLRCHKSLATIV